MEKNTIKGEGMIDKRHVRSAKETAVVGRFAAALRTAAFFFSPF